MWNLLLLFIFHPFPGSTQATNKDSIQKMIGRLDEDLSTLGQISKLSETLSLPHQVLWKMQWQKTPSFSLFAHLLFLETSSSLLFEIFSYIQVVTDIKKKLYWAFHLFSLSSTFVRLRCVYSWVCVALWNSILPFFPFLSAPRRGNKGSDGLGAQGAVG